MSLPSYPPDYVAPYVQPPHQEWTYGMKVDTTPEGQAWLDGEKEGWTLIDPAKESPRTVYNYMTTGISPRPIAFVSSVSESGVENLAPFSWFTMVSEYPPVLSFSITNPEGASIKDTAANIRATKSFVVNIISQPFVHQANATSVETPSDVSEWDFSGLTKTPSVHVKAPRVKESAFSMECELYQAIDIVHPDTGRKTNTFVLGLVKLIHARNDVLTAWPSVSNPGETVTYVDPVKLKAVARLGANTYATLGPLYRVDRATWEGDQEKINEAVKNAVAQ